MSALNFSYRGTLATLGAVVVGALALEGLARVWLPLDDPEPVVPPAVRQFDPELGWVNRPSARAVSHRTGAPVEYRINAQGLRDAETPYENPEGRLRIVLVGDSRTFGFGVPIEDHFSTLLETRLAGVDVVNLGVGAYGIDQELLLLEREGFRYEPDLVIAYVAHYGAHRHMHSVRFGAPKPRFRLLGDELELIPITPTATGAPAGIAALAARSRAFDALRRGLGGRLCEADDQIVEVSSAGTDSADPRFVEALHRLGTAIVVAMHRTSETRGARFLLVTQIPRLQADASRAGVEVLDVRDTLDDPGFALSDGLGHLNGAGNQALAEAIAAALEARPDLLPAVSR